jgi:four helix bundle protein
LKGRGGEEEKGRGGEILKYLLIFVKVAVKYFNMKIFRSHKELEVYQLAFKSSMEIYHLTKTFPKEEIFSLTSQIRKSSRSVSANIAEAFRKRRYEKAFVSKLSDSEAEAAETQVWLDYSLECRYISEAEHYKLFNEYDNILGKLVNMMNHPEKWSI